DEDEHRRRDDDDLGLGRRDGLACRGPRRGAHERLASTPRTRRIRGGALRGAGPRPFPWRYSDQRASAYSVPMMPNTSGPSTSRTMPATIAGVVPVQDATPAGRVAGKRTA